MKMHKLFVVLLALACVLCMGCKQKSSKKDEPVVPVYLTITTMSLPKGVVGVPYSATLEANGEFTPFIWSIESGSLPSGLSLNFLTGKISGTPDAEGTYFFTVCATDTEDHIQTKKLSITVNTVTLTTKPPLPDGTIGMSYSTTIEAIGGVTPYYWSVEAGDLPSGLSLNSSTGEISGTPDAEGSFTFEICVTDDVDSSDEKEFTIQVNTVTITTKAPLPDGTIDMPYSKTFEAVGGVTPYTWSIEAGDLPSGLSLNPSTGEISGNPDEEGSSTFTICVTDDVDSSDEREFTIKVNDAVGPGEYVTKCYPQQSEYWTGYATLTEKFSGDIKVYYDGVDDTITKHGFAKFDISAIPDGAIIVSVTLHLYVTSVKDAFDLFKIPNLKFDPETATAEEIVDGEVGFAIYNAGPLDATGWKVITFLGLGLSAFRSSYRTSEYFALKFYGC